MLATLAVVVGCASVPSHAPASYTATSVCAILRNPEAFAGKHVTIYGTFRYAFEVQQLYCLECFQQGPMWLEFVDDETEWPPQSSLPRDQGTVNVVVRGILDAGDTYGHLNGYRSQLRVTEILDASVVAKMGVLPSYLPAASRARVCQR